VLNDFTRGVFRENPVFVTLVGLCPSLAITTHVVNALGLGAAVVVVMVLSSLTVALIGDRVPAGVRTPAYLAVIAIHVTIVDLIMSAYLPELSARLGFFVPLIVVNCLILGRADAFAREVVPGRAVLDALGMGIGFVLSLTLIAVIRETLGSGTITVFPFGSFDGVVAIPGLVDRPVAVIGLATGAFFVVGYLKAIGNWISARRAGTPPVSTRGIREEDL
jgi:electron transport complex protein RnfE